MAIFDTMTTMLMQGVTKTVVTDIASKDAQKATSPQQQQQSQQNDQSLEQSEKSKSKNTDQEALLAEAEQKQNAKDKDKSESLNGQQQQYAPVAVQNNAALSANQPPKQKWLPLLKGLALSIAVGTVLSMIPPLVLLAGVGALALKEELNMRAYKEAAANADKTAIRGDMNKALSPQTAQRIVM